MKDRFMISKLETDTQNISLKYHNINICKIIFKVYRKYFILNLIYVQNVIVSNILL